MTEPWMRGPLEGVHPAVAPLLYSFQQAREDLARYTDGLENEKVWARPAGAAPVGFHIRHAGGAARRLMTYALGGQLTDTQLAGLRAEMDAGAGRDELLREMDAAFREVEDAARGIRPEQLFEPREVGRKKLPSTVIGLLVHIAEHTQRHVGQAITTARLVRGY